MIPLDHAHHLGAASMAGARAGHRANVRTSFGFTAPTIIYEEMRAVDQDAARLDGSVTAYVTDPVFLAAWRAWLANWRDFVHRYLDSNAQKLAAVFYTDDLARQVETYRLQLQGLYTDYARQQGATPGSRLPALAPPAVAAPPLVPGQTTSPITGKNEPSLLPWWGWMLLGVGAVGGVYWAYRRYVAPKFGAARDLAPSLARRSPPGAMIVGRDHPIAAMTARDEPDEPPDPLSLEEYASDPRAQGLWYRPFEHPHLVPVSVPPPRRLPPPRPAPDWQGWSGDDGYPEEDA